MRCAYISHHSEYSCSDELSSESRTMWLDNMRVGAYSLIPTTHGVWVVRLFTCSVDMHRCLVSCYAHAVSMRLGLTDAVCKVVLGRVSFIGTLVLSSQKLLLSCDFFFEKEGILNRNCALLHSNVFPHLAQRFRVDSSIG